MDTKNMKPKQIRITETVLDLLEEDKIYDVVEWTDNSPIINIGSEYIGQMTISNSKWEPVFLPGNPVWAWDDCKITKEKGIYIGKSQYPVNFPYAVDKVDEEDFELFKNISWREERKQITLNELAEKAGIDLDDYEIVK